MPPDDLAQTEDELLQLNRRLLDAIGAGDWNTYVELCDPSLTCFEPEARGTLVTGLEFHHFYFHEGRPRNSQITLIEPEVRMLGPDAAVITYVRLVQSRDGAGGGDTTSRTEETRVWRRRDGRWRLVHLHRSANP